MIRYGTWISFIVSMSVFILVSIEPLSILLSIVLAIRLASFVVTAVLQIFVLTRLKNCSNHNYSSYVTGEDVTWFCHSKVMISLTAMELLSGLLWILELGTGIFVSIGSERYVVLSLFWVTVAMRLYFSSLPFRWRSVLGSDEAKWKILNIGRLSCLIRLLLFFICQPTYYYFFFFKQQQKSIFKTTSSG